MQYVRGIFIESYDPTLEDSFSKQVKLGGSRSEAIDVEILDTAGTDQFSAMRDMYIGTGDAFMIVYAVDSKASFNEACSLFDRIKTIRDKKVLMRAKERLNYFNLTDVVKCPCGG